MFFPNFGLRSPHINAGMLENGKGIASMDAAADAWFNFGRHLDGAVMAIADTLVKLAEVAWQGDGSGLEGVADDHFAEFEGPAAGPGGEPVRVFGQQTGHTAADRAAADQGDPP